MKRSLRLLVGMCLSLVILNGLAFGQRAESQTRDKHAPSLVSITAYDENDKILSTGRGFFVNATGDLATNYHVLSGSHKAMIETMAGERGFIGEIVKSDPKLDLIVAGTTLRHTIPLPLGDSDKIKAGDDMMIIGHRVGVQGAVSTGVIVGVIKAEEIELIQITAPISPGSSGAPILNGSGKVIGIATAFLDLGEKKSFAMPVNYLKNLKPTRLKLPSLQRATTGFEAVVQDGRIIEVHTRQGKSTLAGNAGIKTGGRKSTDFQELEGSNRTIGSVLGIVYFKNGKRLVCDRAWRNGNTIMLLAHGKQIAVGYESSEIDMARSFALFEHD